MKIACTAVAVGLFAATVASAQVTVSPRQSHAAAAERYVLRVFTMGEVATTAIELEIPPGVTVTGILETDASHADAKQEHGHIVRVVWKQTIKPGEVAEFVFFARNPDASEVRWRARQHFANGTAKYWVDPVSSPRPGLVVKLTPQGSPPNLH